MNTNVKKQSERIGQQKENELIEFLSGYDDIIHNAYRKIYGVSAWYKAFLVSEDFSKERDDFKKESFETYNGLIQMLDLLESKADDNYEAIKQLQ
jgi:hypothetical protein